MRARRGRCARKIPSARGFGDLRGAGADGAGILASLSADRWPGQLRFGRRRRRRSVPLHRMPAAKNRGRDACRHRPGNRRLHAELRRQGDGADGAADAAAQPAHQRLVRDRRRHGDQHPAAQPDRSRERLPRPARPPGNDRRRADRHRSGARFSDRGNHLRRRGRARGLPHRPRPRRDARTHTHRRTRERQSSGDHRRRDSLPGEQGEPAHPHRRARSGKEARRPLGPATSRTSPACAWSSS